MIISHNGNIWEIVYPYRALSHFQEFEQVVCRIATFNFLDLDHNGYVGANEVRHILINMGELIADEDWIRFPFAILQNNLYACKINLITA